MIEILYKALKKIAPGGLTAKLNIYHYRKGLVHILRQYDSLIKYNSFDHFRAVDAENITACNRRCSYCSNSRFDRGLMKNKRLMDTGVFYKIIDELSEINFRGRITPNFYGEPLLDERLPGLMAYARRKLPKAFIVIYTNGDFLTLDLYKKLLKAGVNRFVISQHGSSMPARVKEVIDYRKQKGDDSVDIRYLIIEDNSCLSSRGGLVHPESIFKRRQCYKATEILTIDYAGNVVLCCNDYFSSVKFGNVRNENLLDIWYKSVYKRIRRDLRKGIFDLDICKRCIAGI